MVYSTSIVYMYILTILVYTVNIYTCTSYCSCVVFTILMYIIVLCILRVVRTKQLVLCLIDCGLIVNGKGKMKKKEREKKQKKLLQVMAHNGRKLFPIANAINIHIGY